MDLKNLNVQEMNQCELVEIEGGFPPVVLAAWAIMATIDVALIAIYASET
jgi:lactobin A/cerein 7B family class IIb bacteriocin